MRPTRGTKKYVGLNNDNNGGLTPIGRMIRDAWVFGLLPEDETCEGWELTRIDAMMHQVNEEWDKYGCLASQLPDELRERHQRIYSEAVEQAKQKGWNGENELQDDN